MEQASRLYGDWLELSESWDPGPDSHLLCGVFGDGLMPRNLALTWKSHRALATELWERDDDDG